MFASPLAATMFAPGLLLVTVPIAVLYVPFLMTARWLSRRLIQRRVEDMLDHIERDAALPAGRRRS